MSAFNAAPAAVGRVQVELDVPRIAEDRNRGVTGALVEPATIAAHIAAAAADGLLANRSAFPARSASTVHALRASAADVAAGGAVGVRAQRFTRPAAAFSPAAAGDAIAAVAIGGYARGGLQAPAPHCPGAGQQTPLPRHPAELMESPWPK